METLAAKEYGYVLLAIAITRQAAKDYQSAYQQSLDERRTTRELAELEEWFRSPLGKLISLDMGETIMKRIQNHETVIEDWEE